MLELLLIRNLLILEYYNKYRQYIRIKKDEKELTNIYLVLDILIETYKRDILYEEFKLSVLSKYPEYVDLLLQIENSNISPDILSDKINELIERAQAYDLAVLSIAVSEGRKSVSEILDFYSKFKDKERVEDVEFITDNLEDLYRETLQQQGLRWRLPTLNKMLGSLRKGDFGFLFARPETGKTTFLASEVTYFAEQVDRPILWFNNEEMGNKVKIRCYQAALGCTLPKLFSNRDAAERAFLKKTNRNILIYDNAATHKRQVEAICKQYNPSLLIFDQIDKIKGFVNDREDLRLGSIYVWARELAKTYCPVIGVCQADVSGEGRKWLDMACVANAKTSKQAEADWILGIGAVHDIGMEQVRFLHLSKNKLTGDEDTDPTQRHGRKEVLIKPDIARYAEL